MKTLIIILTFLFLQPTGYVNDRVGLLDQATINNLENTISSFEQQTDIEIAVLIEQLPEGRDAFSFALEKAEGWGVGKDGADNGIVIYLAPKARKWQILTGYGVESYLTDAKANRIGRSHIVPNMRDSNPNQAVISAVGAIIETLGSISMAERERMAQLAAQKRQEKLTSFFWYLTYFAVGLGVLIIIGLIYRRKQLNKELAKKERQEYEQQTDKLEHIISILRILRNDLDIKDDSLIERLDQIVTERDKKPMEGPEVPQDYLSTIYHYRDKIVTGLHLFKSIEHGNILGVAIPENLRDDPTDELQEEHTQQLKARKQVQKLRKSLRSEITFTDAVIDLKSLVASFDTFMHHRRSVKARDDFVGNIDEHASIEINLAKSNYDSLKGGDTESKTLIKKAENAYGRKDYFQAYKFAVLAKNAIEDEADDRARAARRRRRRRNSSSTTWTTMNSGTGSSSGSTGGSFGGFGGGSFGGGGAGGSW